MGARGVDESAFKLQPSWEGPVGESQGRQPYSGNPTVRDDKGGLRKRRPWWNEAPTLHIERASAGNSPPKVVRAAVLSRLGALWRAVRTPPGSESGACLQRGDSGTWESHLAPCHRPGMGDRVTKS